MNLMKSLEVGIRYNLISTNNDNSIDVIASFIAWSVQNNMRCIYYVDNDSYEELEFWLKIHCMNLNTLIKKGSLVIRSAYEYFIENKLLDNYKLVVGYVKDALAEGYNGLAIVADRECFINYGFSEKMFHRYEEQMINFFENYPVAVMTCYNIDLFGVEAIFALTSLNSSFIYKRDNEIYMHVRNNNEKANLQSSELVYNFLKIREKLIKENNIYNFIGKLSSELTFKKDEKDIMEAAICNICSATNSKYGVAVLKGSSSGVETVVRYNISEENYREFITEKNCREIIHNKKMMEANCYILSYEDITTYDKYHAGILREYNILNCIFIPIKIENEPVGCIWIGSGYKYTNYKENSDLLIKACEILAKIVEDYREHQKILNSMIQASKINALGELTGGIAHEFNNVLMPIIGYTEILKKELENTPFLKCVDMIQSSAMDGAEIVKRIQEFTNSKKRDKEVIDVDEIIRRSIEITKPKWTYESKFQNKEISVEYSLNSEALIEGVSTELREVFINLIGNSIDALPNGGNINITSYNDGKSVIIKFRDNGIGMPSEVINRIFEPFFTTKNERGNGLGLAIVYNIIKNMNGIIEVASEHQNGTEFTITFPIKNSKRFKAHKEKSSLLDKSYSILVVDDQLAVAQTVTEMLKLLGHNAVFITDENEVVNVFEKNSFDCVFCDLALKNLSGIDLSKMLKRINNEVPLVLMTGWTGKLKPEDLIYIDKIITKPFSLDELNLILDELLSNKEKEA